MQITDETLSKIEDKFGWCSSWAIWNNNFSKPKENIGDLSVFDWSKFPENRLAIHANYIAVGLNISKCLEFPIFSNFHSNSPSNQDFKIRFAFIDTPLWGSYMTDILKGFPEIHSSNVRKFIKHNPNSLVPHFKVFDEELRILCATDAVFLAFGQLSYELLKCALPMNSKIVPLRHYSVFVSKEEYRQEVAQRVFGYDVRE